MNMEIQYIDPKLLKPSEYNPRQMTERQVSDLTKSIRKYGLIDPILVNSNIDRYNVVIGGHQRLQVALRESLELVPIVYINLTERDERELNLRLNKNNGEWDWDKLAEFDEELLLESGFESKELATNFNLFDNIGVDEDNKDLKNDENNNKSNIITCPECGHTWDNMK